MGEIVQSQSQSTPLRHVTVALQRAKDKVKHLTYLQNKLLGTGTLVTCGKCNASHAINTLCYIQSYWYVPPSGCTEGDYWKQGEGRWECPSCLAVVRLIHHPDVVGLKNLFKTHRECHCRCGLYAEPCSDCKKLRRTHVAENVISV